MNFSKFLRRCRWLLALLLGSQAHAANFAADPEIQQIAEAYALDARDFAERAFGITLDWSDASVEKVEVVLDKLYRQKQVMKPPPTEEQVLSRRCSAGMWARSSGAITARSGAWSSSAATHFPACAPQGPSISSGRWAKR
jgi:hypothetical protein